MQITKFKDWSFFYKIISLAAIIIIPIIIITVLFLLPNIEEKLFEEKELNSKNVVQLAYSLIEGYQSRYEKGEFDLTEAQRLAEISIGLLRYNTDDYCWINDLNHKMIMHPFKPEMNGTDISNYKDPNGKRIFAEMVSLCKEEGDGFVNYMWSKPGFEDPVPKISYVKLFKPWGWVIGTGVYVDDVETEMAALKQKILLALLLIIAVAFGFSYYYGKLLSNPLNKLSSAVEKIANGELNVFIEIESQDEIGKLSQSFNQMSEKIAVQLENLDALAAIVMTIDSEFNITYINKIAADALGKKQNQLIGQKCYDQFNTDQCRTEDCACFRAMKNNSVNTAETIARPNGVQIPIQYTGRPTYDRKGNINGAIEFVVDITKVKEQEKYLDEYAQKLLTEMDKFAVGDLTATLEVENSDDVMGKLYNGFNRVVNNIREIIIGVTEAVQATASASNQISSSTEEMATGSQEQSAQTTEVASAIEQMTSTILQTSQNAGSAADFSKKAGLAAKNGGEVVKETVNGMNRIAEVVNNASSIVKQLGNSSNQIGEIIQVIDDIADQTNLLALNAAIEAARAGEQGRGFAVVADEVRKLAERTTKATKEIALMIKQIQNDTGKAVTSIDSGTAEVESGKTLANKAISALGEIIDSTNDTIDVVNQVAAASEEQSSAAEQISKSIEGISNVTHESALGIQQIARASEDLSNLTNNLQNLISKFKIDSNDYNLDRKQNKQVTAGSNKRLINS